MNVIDVDECVICLEHLSHNPPFRGAQIDSITFPCHHQFHKSCIINLVAYSTDLSCIICPLCNKVFRMTDLLKLDDIIAYFTREVKDYSLVHNNFENLTKIINHFHHKPEISPNDKRSLIYSLLFMFIFIALFVIFFALMLTKK